MGEVPQETDERLEVAEKLRERARSMETAMGNTFTERDRYKAEADLFNRAADLLSHVEEEGIAALLEAIEYAEGQRRQPKKGELSDRQKAELNAHNEERIRRGFLPLSDNEPCLWNAEGRIHGFDHREEAK